MLRMWMLLRSAAETLTSCKPTGQEQSKCAFQQAHFGQLLTHLAHAAVVVDICMGIVFGATAGLLHRSASSSAHAAH